VAIHNFLKKNFVPNNDLSVDNSETSRDHSYAGVFTSKIKLSLDCWGNFNRKSLTLIFTKIRTELNRFRYLLILIGEYPPTLDFIKPNLIATAALLRHPLALKMIARSFASTIPDNPITLSPKLWGKLCQKLTANKIFEAIPKTRLALTTRKKFVQWTNSWQGEEKLKRPESPKIESSHFLSNFLRLESR